MTESYFLKNLWRWKCGLPEEEIKSLPSLESLKETEWCSEFETLMRNRLVMGAVRYGSLRDFKNKPKYDHINNAINKLKEFQKTGNAELLVETSNYCLLDYWYQYHPNFHFNALDDGGEHCKIIE